MRLRQAGKREQELSRRRVCRSDWPPQALDPLVVDPRHYHLEFENEFVK